MEKKNIGLTTGHSISVEESESENLISLSDQNGVVQLSIVVTSEGPILKFEGSKVLVHATGALAFDAERIAIRGREGVNISSGTDASFNVEGDLSIEASVNNITSTLGNVNVRANDDVKLNGERIKLNS